LIDPGSPTFIKQLKALSKKYRHIETDLATAYETIIKDRSNACNAFQIPGYTSVWKYRCDSSDMARGQSGGFRVLMLWNEKENTLYPFCIYTHADYPSQPPVKDVRKWIKEALEIKPKTTSVALVVVIVECKICGVKLTEEESDVFGDLCAKHRHRILDDFL
jgi:mRNA-degrading endonuclease RelE of RelBE toxin-antitoxin system